MKYIIGFAVVVSIYAVAYLFGPAWGLTYMAALCVAAIFIIQSERLEKRKAEEHRTSPVTGVDCLVCSKEMSYREIIQEKLVCSECTAIIDKELENANNIKK